MQKFPTRLISTLKKIGFKCEVLNLNEFLSINTQQILSPISFEPLKKLLGYYGVDFKKLIYEMKSIEKLKKEYNLRNIRYNKSTDLLGLFYVLVLSKGNL